MITYCFSKHRSKSFERRLCKECEIKYIIHHSRQAFSCGRNLIRFMKTIFSYLEHHLYVSIFLKARYFLRWIRLRFSEPCSGNKQTAGRECTWYVDRSNVVDRCCRIGPKETPNKSKRETAVTHQKISVFLILFRSHWVLSDIRTGRLGFGVVRDLSQFQTTEIIILFSLLDIFRPQSTSGTCNIYGRALHGFGIVLISVISLP